MPPRAHRTALRERYDRRQAQVVLDAAAVFAARGYDQTSVPELALALGVAAGGLYHYFASKEELLIAICDQLMDPLLAEAKELMSTAQAPERQLRELVRLWVAHVIEHRDHMLVFQQERHVIEVGDRWRKVRANRKAFERLASGSLARTIGWTSTEEPLPLLALLGMVNHTAQWFRPRGHLTPQQIADGYVDLVLGAHSAPPR